MAAAKVRIQESLVFLYRNHAGFIQAKKTAGQVADELLEAKAQDNLSPRHCKNLRLQLKEGFAADERFAGRPIYEITTSELETWLRELDVSPTTRNNYRTALGVLFSFALRRGYLLKNPAALAERAKREFDPMA